jgi:hypothetical protein
MGAVMNETVKAIGKGRYVVVAKTGKHVSKPMDKQSADRREKRIHNKEQDESITGLDITHEMIARHRAALKSLLDEAKKKSSGSAGLLDKAVRWAGMVGFYG